MKILNKDLNFNNQSLDILFKILTSHGKARLVGGCVRDKLIGINNSDIDIATSLLPDDIIKILNKNNIKVIETGIKYGTVTAIIKDKKFEITTLRQDIQTDGRHPLVTYCKDFKIDATRRDFTINALSYDLNEKKIYDYFVGFEDLKNNKVCFIGDATERINEDYLRILRFFRFSAKFGGMIDQEGLKASKENVKLLKNLSKERIIDEFTKLLLNTKNIYILKVMNDICIYEFIFNKLKIDINLVTKIFETNKDLLKEIFDSNKVSLLISCMLYKNDLNSIKSTLYEMKFSKKIIIVIFELVHFIKNNTKKDIRYRLNSIFYNNKDLINIYLFIQFLILDNDIDSYLKYKDEYKNLKNINLPISGGDIKNLGYTNKNIGIIHKKCINYWLLNNFKPSKEDIIKNVIKKN